jgi:hypothetical protein
VVIRKVGKDMILVPTVFKQDKFESEIFTTSKTGKLILDKLDGKRTLDTIIEDLAVKYGISHGEIEKDVFDFVCELKQKGLIFDVNEEK